MQNIGEVDEAGTDRERGPLSEQRSRRSKTENLDTGDLGELTKGELLLINRKRTGESQEDASIRLGITRNMYGKIERDEVAKVRIEVPDIDELKPHEKCFLYRRRTGRTQEDCAEEMGISRYWFNQMEIGAAPIDPLVGFWEC